MTDFCDYGPTSTPSRLLDIVNHPRCSESVRELCRQIMRQGWGYQSWFDSILVEWARLGSPEKQPS